VNGRSSRRASRQAFSKPSSRADFHGVVHGIGHWTSKSEVYDGTILVVVVLLRSAAGERLKQVRKLLCVSFTEMAKMSRRLLRRSSKYRYRYILMAFVHGHGGIEWMA
jgi:hypothetical protein